MTDPIGRDHVRVRARVRGRSASGFSLVEIVIVLALFSLVVFVVNDLLMSTLAHAAHSQAWSELLARGQRGVNDVAFELTDLRRIYSNDARGTAMLAALATPSAHPRLGGIRLPRVADTGTFREDIPGDEQTGNCFLLHREAEPLDVVLPSTGQPRRIDTHRLVLFYPSPTAAPVGPYPRGLLLARWTSVDFGDYDMVKALDDSDEPAVAAALFSARGIRHLWATAAASPDAAFYPVDAAGSIAPVPDAAYRPSEASNESVVPDLGLGRATLAWNRTTDAWLPEPAPLFGLADATGDGFPHGFEVQVIGPTGARRVLLRLVVAEYVALDGGVDAYATSVIANAREM